MRISDWSSDVCSSDLGAESDRCGHAGIGRLVLASEMQAEGGRRLEIARRPAQQLAVGSDPPDATDAPRRQQHCARHRIAVVGLRRFALAAASFLRSAEHKSELQSLLRITFTVFCL